MIDWLLVLAIVCVSIVLCFAAWIGSLPGDEDEDPEMGQGYYMPNYLRKPRSDDPENP